MDLLFQKVSSDSTLTSSSYFHNYLRFSLVAGGIRLFSKKKKPTNNKNRNKKPQQQQQKAPKKTAKIKEQDAISSLLESLGKEHHVFSHLCRSFAYCSGSKFKGGGTPGILVQNKMLYSTSKKSFSEILHPYSCFPLQG